MNISQRQQISFDQLKVMKIDFIICASGYEGRSRYLASKLDLSKIQTKIVFAFSNENETAERLENDKYFKEKDFESIVSDSDSDDGIVSCLGRYIDGNQSCRIIVDYSSMSRVWYSSILKYFYYNLNIKSQIELIFCYSVAKFIESPKEDIYNLHIGPINGFSNLTIPQMPTGLIIGLGYEKSRALGLNEYFDGETYIFYTQDKQDNLYHKEVERNNETLLSQVKRENIMRYSVSDINSLYNKLFSLCRDLRNDYRVILASCGPKTFALTSLIISLELENIDVWRISAGKAAVPINKEPTGEVVVFEVRME